jgi:hypothetical protein
MGLLGGIARTAVVAGTATAVSNNVSRRQSARWADQQAQQEPQQYQAAPPAIPAQADDMDARIEQLEKLAQLRDQGILTDAEFQSQKQQLLT